MGVVEHNQLAHKVYLRTIINHCKIHGEVPGHGSARGDTDSPIGKYSRTTLESLGLAAVPNHQPVMDIPHVQPFRDPRPVD